MPILGHEMSRKGWVGVSIFNRLAAQESRDGSIGEAGASVKLFVGGGRTSLLTRDSLDLDDLE